MLQSLTTLKDSRPKILQELFRIKQTQQGLETLYEDARVFKDAFKGQGRIYEFLSRQDRL